MGASADSVVAYTWKPTFGILVGALLLHRSCSREGREHMPLIGPTKDRQMLALVTKLANSDTIRSLMCFCCDQIFTDVHCWRQSMSHAQHNAEHCGRSCGEIKLYEMEILYQF